MIKLSNRLKQETSPYLLQHAENPVEWYPWCREAFEKAEKEDKPVFLSIGYSTCHWCHVMAHESFEDEEIADLLNRHFVCIKVDKEERPDIDSIYMAVCQAFTGGGGWPTSIFMTADQKPFFAGTYFAKSGGGKRMGLKELLTTIRHHWENDRKALLEQADAVVAHLNRPTQDAADPDTDPLSSAVAAYERSYDTKYGGFGRAPKFPAPHNLLFLLTYHQRYGHKPCRDMAEHTLLQMYRGGLFDHIGYGFCRYSTDKQFLVPHFEKMLYDNALLILAYCKAAEGERSGLYRNIAQKTADYVLREMTSPGGGFYSAQDADSEREEGKYYLFTPREITDLLGDQAGKAFNRRFGITDEGNFEKKNIPNLLHSDAADTSFEQYLPQIYAYRKKRYGLILDDKILTSWNGLMIAAMCALYRASQEEKYLTAAVEADRFLGEHLQKGDTLFVSYREGKRGVKGFLDDYASYIFAQLALYGATLDEQYLSRAKALCQKVLTDFSDPVNGGFYLYGHDSEELILHPKETYDGAIPSGNSLMAYNLVRLSHLTEDARYPEEARRQLDFLSAEASYPPGHAMFLLALLEHREPPMKVRVVATDEIEPKALLFGLPADALVTVQKPSGEYPLKDGKTTFYVCRNHSCLPPVNDFKEIFSLSQ